MNIVVVTDREEFEALRPAWSALLARARVASVFLSWEWLYPWWRHYGIGHALRLLVAYQGGSVVGILPVYIQTKQVMRLVPVRTLRFLGTGGDTAPDDLDALLEPAHASEAAQALAAYATTPLKGWDVLCLTDMAADSEFRRALARELTRHRFTSFAEGLSSRISYLRLPSSWGAYLESQNRHRRYALRRARRIVESQPGARFVHWSDIVTLDRAIDRLIELHRMRWQERAEHHAFSSHAYNDFHREVMHLCSENDWLRLYCLELGGAIIAMSYCYRFRDQVFHFQSGFDPALSKLSPGLVLMGYAIEHAIGERNSVFDMLRGEYEYKTQWAPERRETYFCQAYRPSFGAIAYRLRHEWLPAPKRWFKGKIHRDTAAEAGDGTRQVSPGA